ncbi:alpha/beta fold hydrolase, partial [Eubacteriales bacterium OttesenSCG-928-A19]|nr:alpha/beta fold hydrolase [Eubacteriales bacterium OttesenSCG-928-A19]
MKKTWIAGLLALLLAATAMAGGLAQGEPEYEAIMGEVAHELTSGEYLAVIDRLSDDAKAQLTAEMIASAWEATVSALGAYEGIERSAVGEDGGFIVAQAVLKHENGSQILTLAFQPGESALAGLYLSQQIAYVEEEPLPVPEGATEEEIVLRAGEADETHGALVLPAGDGPFPVAILLHGSGASDLDETIYGVKPFRDLAMGLAERGVATLRYDKYSYAHPDEMMKDVSIALEYEKDLLDAVALLQADERVGDIYLIGHSEGGMMVPRMLALVDGAAKGGVIMAGSPRPLWEIQEMQNEDVIARMDEAAQAEARALVAAEAEKAQRMADMTPEELQTESVFGITAAYQLDVITPNPIQAALDLELPLLIVQGDKDWQVSMEHDFAAWQEGLSGADFVTLELYPDLNHLFFR